MKTSILHYIYDPVCGWCYGAAPLIKSASDLPDIQIELHAGGLWMGADEKKVTPQLREFVMTNDARISQLTGQVFGDGYFNGLLTNHNAIITSEPPIRAILAAQCQSPQMGLPMLQAIQQAHFVKGHEVSQAETLIALAQDLGLNVAQFEADFNQVDVQNHVTATRQLMTRFQAQGFPTLLLEINGHVHRLNHSGFYGDVDGFVTMLKHVV